MTCSTAANVASVTRPTQPRPVGSPTPATNESPKKSSRRSSTAPPRGQEARARATSESSPVSVWLLAAVISTGTISPGAAKPLKFIALLRSY